MVDFVPVGPVPATEVPRYAGLGTFARLPQLGSVPDYDVAIVGVPFDGGTSFRPGARFGPSNVREASRLLRPGFHPELQTTAVQSAQFVDAGDLSCTPYDNALAVQQIQEQATRLVAKDKTVIAIGGDHTIALPMIRATAAVHGPVALLHFDAHLDTWDTYFGEEITHGTMFRRAFEEGLLVEERSMHVGIRGPVYDKDDFIRDHEFGFQIIRCSDIDTMGIPAVVQRIKDRIGNTPVYLSIDIDVLDPAYAPGTGTPEMGGMHSREILQTLRGLGTLNIVGADVVEVAPAYDHADITSLAAATLVFEMMSLLTANK
ncbi:agmatinase [Arthrobacter sp. MYb211]|uniref:agmatinase n=1 Tax=Micrococcaceae TaxID=1268 RepID=UPI000BB87E46|nr:MULTISPECIES: agmatinase [Micrococcaceae]PCC36843.1 agmatinase [Glutamicibacter sp. BW77]PRA00137.1 agmatinase [Arthrobacter sp. MYb224]PRA04310.1 agmatinase [Arthrobacter sp. MYb229]PRA10280.1 agmatinase [Arthrobacter sp. MYb221]PRB51778.1 agmatinase [Arthrobacter sp. MYb216]